MERCVFVSYVDKDKDIAEQMCEFLEKKGVKCCYKHRDIPVDEHDNQMFESSFIESSSCIVIILSNSFVKSDKIKSLTSYADKCIIFTIDNVNLEECGLAAVTSVNAFKHPTKMFGHVLSEIKKLIGDSKNKYSACAVISIISIIFLFMLALFAYERTVNEDEEKSFSEYKDISQNDFFEKYMQARQSQIIETELPFGKAEYGISLHEWERCIKRMLDEEDITLDEKRVNGIILPKHVRVFEMDTSKDLRLILNPLFDDSKGLYILIAKVERKAGLSQKPYSLLDEVLTDIIGVSNKYLYYDKYHVLEEGQIASFYSLIKNNELVNVREIDPSYVEIVYINAPCIPKDIFENDFIASQVNNRLFFK